MATEDLFGKLGDFFSKSTQALRDRFTLDAPDLIRAVEDNKVEEIARALRAGVNPNKADGLERLALPIAVDNNRLEIIQLLLAAEADPALTGPDGEPPLYKAVTWENLEIIHALLKAGANVQQKSASGRSAIQEAQESGNQAIIDLLGGHYEQVRSEQVAQDKARHEALKAKAQQVRREQEEAQQQQALEAQQQQLNALKEQYQIVDDNYLPALIKAIRQGHQGDANFLLPFVEDINALDRKSLTTPLMAAILHKNVELTQALIEKGADFLSIVPKYHHSPLTYAIKQDYHKLVDLMLSTKIPLIPLALNDPDQVLSPQFLAYKNPKMLNLLLGAGADPFFGGTEAPAPIVKAIEKASVAVLPVLSRNRINLNRLAEGQSLIAWAIHFERQDWLIGLIKEGANIDQFDEKGSSPLMLAVKEQKPEFVSILLEEHADTTLKNQDGQTALEMAEAMEGQGEMVALLQSYN